MERERDRESERGRTFARMKECEREIGEYLRERVGEGERATERERGRECV